ncbi:MAG: FAD-binding oxidoreductase [Chloroflexota bacterium]
MQSRILKQLRSILGIARVSVSGADRQLHAQDQSDYDQVLPDVVVWPQTTQEVSEIVQLANRYKVPVTAWGAGTSLEGNSIPVQKGIVIDFSHMAQIIDLHERDLQVTVQAGVMYKDMNAILAEHGLFFAPDPGANASIGGMIATNAAGPHTIKYGSTNENVLALEVVLANGEIIQTGSRSIKQAAGYNLTQLFAGSEGTLGLVTQATLKLEPIPKRKVTATAVFNNIIEIATAVSEIIGNGMQPAALELLDENTAQTLFTEADLDIPLGSSLLIEFSGNTAAWMEKQMEVAQIICEDHGCIQFNDAHSEEESQRLWRARKQIRRFNVRKHPSHKWLITDVSVPISQFPKMVQFTADSVSKLNINCNILGHAGDGNLLIGVHYKPNDKKCAESANRFKQMQVSKAIGLGGTCAGEHGVGIGKRQYMVQEHGYPAITLMKQLKETLDPNNILNPGKIFLN